MKIRDEISHLEVIGTATSAKVSIGNHAKIMKHLFSDLYKDPKAAAVREILSNARDANREAKKPSLPIKIELPTALQPSLRISDAGIGISLQRMNEIYRGIGNSTKNDDNEQTGGFGLGSKAPWSFVENFNIATSYAKKSPSFGWLLNRDKNVRKDFWTANRKDGGEIFLMGSLEEPGESGTTIEIPIQPCDFDKIKTEVYRTINFWEVQPEIHPSSPPRDFTPNDFSIRTKTWGTYQSHCVSGLIAIIDGIHYKIDIDALEVDYNLRPLFKQNIALFFANGQLSLSISRDYLHYDSETIKLLKEAIDLFLKEYIETLKSKILESEDFLSALRLYVDVCHQLKQYAQPLEGLQWQNIELKRTLRAQDLGSYAEIRRYSSEYTRAKKNKTVNWDVDTIDLINECHPIYFTETKDFDLEKVKYLVHEEHHNSIILIVMPTYPQDESYRLSLVAKNLPLDTEANYDMTYIPFISMESLDEFEIPPKGKKKMSPRILSSKDRKQIVARKLNCSYTFEKISQLIDNAQGGFYVQYDPVKHAYKINNKWFTGRLNDCFQTFVPKLDNNDPSWESSYPFRVIAVTKQVLPYLCSTWKPLESYLRERFAATLATSDYTFSQIKEIIYIHGLLSSSAEYYLEGFEELYEEFLESGKSDLYKPDSELVQFLNVIKHLKTDVLTLGLKYSWSADQDYELISLVKAINNGYYNSTDLSCFLPSGFEALYEKLKEKYPILFWLMEDVKANMVSNKYQYLVDYMLLVQKKA